MKYFDFNGYQVRLIDFRPTRRACQINVYNPADTTSSFGRMQNLSTSAPSDIDELFAALVSDGIIEALVNRAIAIWGA